MSNYNMEICIDSIQSAKNAIKGGANRLEACSALSEGGLTPSPGLIQFIKTYSNVPVFAMIRIRHGNFIYTKEEIDAMLYDLQIFHNIGVDGFVFGALNSDYTVDIDCCSKIIAAAKSKPVTFHRAFDETKNPLLALEKIIDLGFKRILTSGQRNTAVEGLELITELVTLANHKIIVMPGCGITPENIELIKKKSGANEFHASARVYITGIKNEISNVQIENKLKPENTDLIVASESLIKRMVDIIKK